MYISKKYFNKDALRFVNFSKISLLQRLGKLALKPRHGQVLRLLQNKLQCVYFYLIEKFSVTYHLSFNLASSEKLHVDITTKDQMLYSPDSNYGISHGNTLFFILDHIKSDINSFYDIGSNIGMGGGSFFIATKELDINIYAFDPCDEPSRIFCEISNSFNNKRIKHFNCALSDKRQKVYLDNNMPYWSGYSMISNSGIEIEANTIDYLVDSGEVDPPDFIKIDVEHHEYNVLIGSASVIKKNKPMIFFENSYVLDENQQRQILSFFAGNEYEIYTVGFMYFDENDTWKIAQKIDNYKDNEIKVCFIPKTNNYLIGREIPRDLNLLAIHKSKINQFFREL